MIRASAPGRLHAAALAPRRSRAIAAAVARPAARMPAAVAPAVVAAVVVQVVAGCSRRDDLDGERRPIAGLSEAPREHVLSRPDDRPAYDFVDNRASAVVHAGGAPGDASGHAQGHALIVELGTAEGAKYTEGGYRSPWRLVTDGGVPAALVPGLSGALDLPVERDPGGAADSAGPAAADLELAVRARAARPRQLVSVFLDERKLGDVPMPSADWQTYRLRVPAAAAPRGEARLRLYFRHTDDIGGTRTAAAIARIALGAPGARVDRPAVRAAPVVRGDALIRALRTTGPARLSHYLRVPGGGPALVFAVAGEGTARVIVTGETGASQVAWEGRAGLTWTEARVELADRAGQLARIDLASDGAVDWGRPQLVVTGPGPAGPSPASAPPRGSPESPAAGAPAGGSPGRPAADGSPGRPAADHVIVWAISSLRADHVPGSDGAPPMPALARLIDRGVQFTNARTVAPAPGPANAALLTGRYPGGGRVPEAGATVAERMSRAGYATALISGNGFVNDEAGFARGFGVYENPMRRRQPFRARILWQRARAFLRRHARGRAFVYVATVEPHLPYTPSDESLAAEWDGGPARFEPAQSAAAVEAAAAGREPLSDRDAAYLRALYRAEVRDADAALAEMLDELDESGAADRTAVIVVGDHGQELGERGVFGHGASLSEQVLRVPLVIAGPGLGRGVTVDRAVDLVDVAATALDLAGVAPGPELQGLSLAGHGAGVAAGTAAGAGGADVMGRPVLVHLPGYGRALVVGQLKLVVPLHGASMLYDLTADPGETRDVMALRPLAARYMRNVFGLGVAFEDAWVVRRWGTPVNTKAAFASDQGV